MAYDTGSSEASGDDGEDGSVDQNGDGHGGGSTEDGEAGAAPGSRKAMLAKIRRKKSKFAGGALVEEVEEGFDALADAGKG